jgi:tetratricopeptide (TPR) repeat protein
LHHAWRRGSRGAERVPARYDKEAFGTAPTIAEARRVTTRRTRSPYRRRVVDAVASQLRGVDADLEASNTFDALLELPVDKWSAFLAARPNRRTESLVARLIAEGRKAVSNEPDRALAMFLAAEEVTNTLKDVLRLARYRGVLAKERAHALRVLGRYTEALADVDAAEAFLSEVPASAYDLTFVRWTRATILFDMGRYPEALSLAVAVVRSFEKFEDLEYAHQARILVADLLCERGAVEDALAMYRELQGYFEEQDDDEITPALAKRIRECETHLADST